MTRPVTVIVLLALALGGTAWRLADTKPDPNTQAIADGCQRDTTKIYTGAAPNWVYVNDRDFPATGPPPSPRWVAGTVQGPLGLLASRIASSDDPITHHSYDVNLDVTVAHADDFLTGASRDATPEQGTLHLERESSSYPEWARPQAGDHVEALGSWIWDCDHYQGRGEKTEFHPFRAIWVARHGASPRSRRGDAEGDLFVSTDPTPAGKQAECAHRMKGSDQFKACSHSAADWWSVNGTYRFVLCAPGARRPGDHLVSSIVNKGGVATARPAVVLRKDGCANVVLDIDAPDGKRVVGAWQLFLGWSKPRAAVDHLRLRFDRLLVRRAIGPELRAGQAGLRCEERDDTARADHDRAGGVAAPLERRRHLGPVAGHARSARRIRLQGQAVGELLRPARAALVARDPGPRVRLRGPARLGRPGSSDASRAR